MSRRDAKVGGVGLLATKEVGFNPPHLHNFFGNHNYKVSNEIATWQPLVGPLSYQIDCQLTFAWDRICQL